MRCNHVAAVLAGLAAVALVAADASAMYHPTLGRFLQRDPIGYGDDAHLYGYVRSAPVGRRDPRGLEAIRDDTFGYRALTWDDFTPGAVDGPYWASTGAYFDPEFGELDVHCVCVDDRYCGGSKPSPGSNCYQCFTSWKKCTRLRAVMDPTQSVKDLSKDKLGGADDAASAHVLAHEQGHFRNAEAVARLADTELQTDCNAQIAYYFWGEWAAPMKAQEERLRIVNEIITRAYQRKDSLDKTYDSEAETNHGRNTGSQEKWNAYFHSDAGFKTWAPGWVEVN